MPNSLRGLGNIIHKSSPVAIAYDMIYGVRRFRTRISQQSELHNGKIQVIVIIQRDSSTSVGLNDMAAPRQSSRGTVACFWSTNRKENALLRAPKKRGAHRQLPTPPNE
ncbi:hypothetical protein TNCV_2287561 [Trichonephila clavipes]|nr:hypothetical protein TNCV_2287561 [Trichonephila clavipes]